MSQSRGLGRGFDSLIPTELDVSAPAVSAATSHDAVRQVDPAKIIPNPQQPRTHFDETELNELSNSIKQHGVLQPLVVSDQGNGNYELIAGERRLRASKLAGLEQVPVIVRSFDEQQKLELALIENLQRAELNPIDTAVAYRKLADEFNLSLDQIGQRMGKAKSTVSNVMRLLQLPDEARQAVASGKISEAHGRTLLAVEDPQKQQQLLDAIINQGWTVRQAEQFTREAKGGLATETSKPTHQPDPSAYHADDLIARELTAHLSTKVILQPKGQGGRIVIDYADLNELQRIKNTILFRRPD